MVGPDIRHPHAAQEDALNAAIEARHQGLLDQGRRRFDAGRRPRLFNNVLPALELSIIALDDGMPIQAHDLVKQLCPKTVHDAHNDDKRGNAQHDGDKADRGHQKDEPISLAGQQITFGDEALIAGQKHRYAV